MISNPSIDILAAWRRDTMARLAKVRKQEEAIREAFGEPLNAVRQARYKGKDISWEDQAAVLGMLENIITAVSRMMTMRSSDLELFVAVIDKVAEAELPGWSRLVESGLEADGGAH